MANFSPNRVSSTHKTAARLAGATLGLLLTAGTTLAIASDGDSPPAAELKPYTAQYVTKTRGISLKLDRKLVQKKDGSFELTNGGSKIIAGFNEVAKFHVENARIIPGSYIYQGTGLMNRRREVHFTRGAKAARSLYKDNWYDLPSSDNTFDRMSQMEEMRLQLLQDDTPGESFTVTVADGKRVKDYHLDYVGEEVLKTPVGNINTLHFERLHDDPDRTSETWLAPDWDYMMVKTLHVDDGSPVEVTLTGGRINGVALKGN